MPSNAPPSSLPALHLSVGFSYFTASGKEEEEKKMVRNLLNKSYPLPPPVSLLSFVQIKGWELPGAANGAPSPPLPLLAAPRPRELWGKTRRFQRQSSSDSPAGGTEGNGERRAPVLCCCRSCRRLLAAPRGSCSLEARYRTCGEG